ncbi:MAG TPA: hypothetical protein VII90_00650 [Anaerolineales bacterium]
MSRCSRGDSNHYPLRPLLMMSPIDAQHLPVSRTRTCPTRWYIGLGTTVSLIADSLLG